MAEKGNRRKGVWPEKVMASDSSDRQRVGMADHGKQETRSVTGKGSGKQFEKQTKGEDGRQGEQETRSVAEKESGKQFERQAKGEDGRQGERKKRSVAGKGNGKKFERKAKGEDV
jgi:hypothetical protein